MPYMRSVVEDRGEGGLQCLSAGGALMPEQRDRDRNNARIASPMPFGWGGFDAKIISTLIDTPFGESPMPFGWGGFDAHKLRLTNS